MKKQLLIISVLLLAALVFAESTLIKEPVITEKADYVITEYFNETDTTSIIIKASRETFAFQSLEQWCSNTRVKDCSKEAYFDYLDSEMQPVLNPPAKEIPTDYALEINALKAQVQELQDWQKKFCEINPDNKICG